MVMNDPERDDLSKSGVRMGLAQRTLKRSSLFVGCGLVVWHLLLTLPLMARNHHLPRPCFVLKLHPVLWIIRSRAGALIRTR